MRSRLKITSCKTDRRPVHGACMERTVGNRRKKNHIRIAVSSYRSKLFAEDVEQHLDVLPEVAKSSTEIKIDDVSVGDRDVLLTDKKRSYINCNGRICTYFFKIRDYITSATREDVCDIDVGVGQFLITQRIRRLHPNIGRGGQIQSWDCCRSI